MTLSHEPSTLIVRPQYIGGPLDGGIGPLEPPPATMSSISIQMRGGRYVLLGFDHDDSDEWPVDRAVYQWEVAK